MNEFLRNFVMKTIIKMIDNNIAEWQVREYALGWYSKGVITEEDLEEIDNRYKQPEPSEKVEPVENAEEETSAESTEETEEETTEVSESEEE